MAFQIILPAIILKMVQQQSWERTKFNSGGSLFFKNSRKVSFRNVNRKWKPLRVLTPFYMVESFTCLIMRTVNFCSDLNSQTHTRPHLKSNFSSNRIHFFLNFIFWDVDGVRMNQHQQHRDLINQLNNKSKKLRVQVNICLLFKL